MDPGKIHRHISRPARTCAQPRGGKISRPRDSRNFAVAEGIKVAPILRSFLQGEKRQGFVKCVKRDVCFLPEDTLRLPESIRSIDKWWLRVVVFETDARGDEREMGKEFRWNEMEFFSIHCYFVIRSGTVRSLLRYVVYFV